MNLLRNVDSCLAFVYILVPCSLPTLSVNWSIAEIIATNTVWNALCLLRIASSVLFPILVNALLSLKVLYKACTPFVPLNLSKNSL